MALADHRVRLDERRNLSISVEDYSLDNWISIKEPTHIQTILRALGDEEKNQILTSAMERPHIISEILNKYKIPQTSGYRKIYALINDGLLIPTELVSVSHGNKATKYVSPLQNVRIDIIGNKITVKVKFRSILKTKLETESPRRI